MFNTVGDIFSTMEVLSTVGYHEYRGDYLEYHGGHHDAGGGYHDTCGGYHEYLGGTQITKDFPPMVLNIPMVLNTPSWHSGYPPHAS